LPNILVSNIELGNNTDYAIIQNKSTSMGTFSHEYTTEPIGQYKFWTGPEIDVDETFDL
jgi:hypothetical protein